MKLVRDSLSDAIQAFFSMFTSVCSHERLGIIQHKLLNLRQMTAELILTGISEDLVLFMSIT